MPGVTWTPEQRDGVRSIGRSLVVSAAAGSGKTAVLAGRCVELVARGGVDERRDAPVAAEPCDVDRLLVVTFTNLAARQMRERISARLREAVEAAPAAERERLQRQMSLLPTAEINTLSSFCARLVRRHFNAAGVDPAFAVLDTDQARLLQREAARDAIEAALAEDDDGRFVSLLDDHFDGNDAGVLPVLLAIHQTRNSLVDPNGWQRSFLEGFDAFANGREDTALDRAALAAASAEATAVLAHAQALRAVAASVEEPKLAKLAHYAKGWVDQAEIIVAAVAKGEVDRARELLKEKAARAPGASDAVPGKVELAAALKVVRDPLKPDGPIASLLDFDDDAARAAVASTLDPTRRLLELQGDFERRYAERKEVLRGLDFGDIDRLALRLLDADPAADDPQPTAIARLCRERFAHVLVDEVQDINALQDRLLRLLSRDGDAEGAGPPNLFCVGDVKQSIYRFRLAEPRMFLDRLRDADGARARRIDLQRNFRSRPPLLEAINAVFHNLLVGGGTEIDYADRHALRPDPAYATVPEGGFGGSPIEVHALDEDADSEEGESDEDADDLDRIEREAVFVARRIGEWKHAGRTVLDEAGEAVPLDFRHVAVLMRSQKFNSERFAASLRREGVACHAEVGTGFFAASEVRDVVTLLRAIDNRRQDVPMAALLRSPISNPPAGVDTGDLLGRVRLASPAEGGGTFYEAAVAFASGEDEAATFVQGLLARLDRWRDAAGRLPVAELLRRLLDDTGYNVFVSGLDDAAQRRANLESLLARATRFDRQRRDGLGAFLDYLSDLEDHAEIGQPPALGEGENVVRVMSVHAAKGLEFPVVFLVDCGKRHNQRTASGRIVVDRDFGVAMEAVHRDKRVRYDSPQQTLARRSIREATAAEELRILYVAMTRAKEALVCVGHAAGARVEAWRSTTRGRPPAASVTAGESFLHWLCTAGSKPHLVVRSQPAGDLVPAQRPTADSVPLAIRRRETLAGFADQPGADATRGRLEPYAHGEASLAPALDHLAPPATRDAQPEHDNGWWRQTAVGGEILAADERWLDTPLHVAGAGEGLDASMLRGSVLALWRRAEDGTLAMLDRGDDAIVRRRAAAVERVAGESLARLYRLDVENRKVAEVVPIRNSR